MSVPATVMKATAPVRMRVRRLANGEAAIRPADCGGIGGRAGRLGFGDISCAGQRTKGMSRHGVEDDG